MKADVLALVGLLGAGEADTAALDRRYRDAVLVLDGIDDWTAAVTLLEHGLGPTLDLSDGTLRVLGVAYDDLQLSVEKVRSLEAAAPGWRDHVGTPQAFLVEQEDDRAVRLWPMPDAPSADLSFPLGEPFGRDWPARGVVLFATEMRDDLRPELDLPLALLVLARDFAADTDHRDPRFVDAAEALARLAVEALG